MLISQVVAALVAAARLPAVMLNAAVCPAMVPVQVLLRTAPLVVMAPGVVGKVSVMATLVSAGLPSGLVMTSLSTDVPPAAMAAGVNVLTTLGAATTATHAPVVDVPLVALLPIDDVRLASKVISLLPLVLLACGQTPTVGVALALTLTVMVQLATPAAIVPPVKVMFCEPLLVTVPPHWLAVGAAATIRPTGKVSVKRIPVCAGLPALLVMVNVNVVLALPFDGKLPENALLRVGIGTSTILTSSIIGSSV